MKIVSWNVNGIRAIRKKGFDAWFIKSDADVLCFQETKIHDDDLPEELLTYGAEHNYQSFWHGAKKKGYSSTAVFTRIKPVAVTFGMGDDRFDTEGRVINIEFKAFWVVTVYVPNAKNDLSRLKERQEFDALFLIHLEHLRKIKPVIVCGDLNVAHKEIDLARPKQNIGQAGFTYEEREGMNRYVTAGYVDTFRLINNNKVQYTWWSYFGSARERNIGWRIDYFLVSKELESKIRTAEIWDDVVGSDHCPVMIEIKD